MLKKSMLAAFAAVALATIPASSSHAFFGWRHGCSGCWGGCHGSWGCGGCWGGGWRGSWGCGGWRGCRGSWGCGGCWSGCHGCSGCWGGCHGCFGCSGSWGCDGCHGGYAVSHVGGYYANRGIVHERVIASSQPSRGIIASSPAVKTSLTLHVPADAKVTLAGVATKQTGETRQFATSKLRAGELWDKYTVVVELPQGDQTLREERTIQLTGGKSQELTVNFDSTQVAQR